MYAVAAITAGKPNVCSLRLTLTQPFWARSPLALIGISSATTHTSVFNLIRFSNTHPYGFLPSVVQKWQQVAKGGIFAK